MMTPFWTQLGAQLAPNSSQKRSQILLFGCISAPQLGVIIAANDDDTFLDPSGRPLSRFVTASWLSSGPMLDFWGTISGSKAVRTCNSFLGILPRTSEHTPVRPSTFASTREPNLVLFYDLGLCVFWSQMMSTCLTLLGQGYPWWEAYKLRMNRLYGVAGCLWHLVVWVCGFGMFCCLDFSKVSKIYRRWW